MVGVHLRRATRADAAALAAAAERLFRSTFAPDNDPADIDAYCAEAFSETSERSLVTDASIDTLVMVDRHDAIVAYARLRPGAPPGVPAPLAPLELWRFYVDSTHHGRGLAPQLMTAVVEAARVRGARTLWLGVWEKNPRAIAFYRKAGFTDIGAATFLLGRDLQADRIMARAIG